MHSLITHILCFVCDRTDAIGNSSKCEVLLEGGGFWTPETYFDILHTPGHTAGSLSILVRTNKENVLFTGDHLAYTDSHKALEGFKRYNHGNLMYVNIIEILLSSITVAVAIDIDQWQWL